VYRLGHLGSGADLPHALEDALAAHGVAPVAGEAPLFLEPDQGPVRYRSVLFLGKEGGGASDLYFAAVRHDEDTVYEVARLTNLTRTAGAAELSLVGSGPYAAYLSES